MLSKQSLDVGAQITSALGMDVSATTLGGTPVNTLTSAHLPPASLSMEAYEYDVLAEHIGASARPVEKGVYDTHEAMMEEAAKDAANRLSASIQFARGVINPLIMDVHQKCEEIKQNALLGSAANVKVTVVSRHPLYNDESIRKLIQPYEHMDTTVHSYVGDALNSRLLEGLDNLAFLDMMKGHLEVVQSKIKNMVDVATIDGGLVDIDLSDAEPNNRFNRTSYYGNYTSLVNFLFVHAIVTGKHPSIRLEDLQNEERIKVSKLLAFYGHRLSYQIREMDKDVLDKRMILTRSSDRSEVRVVNEIYRDWLNNGGSVEALIGHVLMQSSDVIPEMDLDQTERYVEKFEQAKRHNDTIDNARVNGEISRTAERCVSEYIRDMEVTDDIKRQKQSELKALCSQTQYNNSRDLVEYIRFISCNVIGKNTDAYELLTGIDSFMRDNTEATLEEAAMYSAAKVLGNWLGSQFIVQTVG